MTHSASVARLGPEFDEFLFAPVAESRNGMLLSVVSALARLDLDPWQEAANLAGLPKDAATQRLASMIAALPDEPSASREPVKIAARLIALLPRNIRTTAPQSSAKPGAKGLANPRTVAFAAFLALTVIIQIFLEANHSPEQTGDPHAASSATERSSGTPPISGQ